MLGGGRVAEGEPETRREKVRIGRVSTSLLIEEGDVVMLEDEMTEGETGREVDGEAEVEARREETREGFSASLLLSSFFSFEILVPFFLPLFFLGGSVSVVSV